ncbi:MAG: hypothetical protein ACP5DC_05975 [Halothiobacillaceae bacterium]
MLDNTAHAHDKPVAANGFRRHEAWLLPTRAYFLDRREAGRVAVLVLGTHDNELILQSCLPVSPEERLGLSDALGRKKAGVIVRVTRSRPAIRESDRRGHHIIWCSPVKDSECGWQQFLDECHRRIEERLSHRVTLMKQERAADAVEG